MALEKGVCSRTLGYNRPLAASHFMWRKTPRDELGEDRQNKFPFQTKRCELFVCLAEL